MVIRIFFALLTLAVLGLAIASSIYILEKVEKPKVEAVREIKEADPPAPIDPGIGEFATAMELIEAGDLEAARDKLRYIIRYFPKSVRYEPARRLCSQLNLDLVLSPRVAAGKSSYEVQRGDALSRIAGQNETTLEYIKSINGLVNFRIMPGDQLLVRPLAFEVAVDVSDKTLTLTEGGEFFAEYPVADIRLPGSVHPPVEDELKSKGAQLDGKGVDAGDAGYDEAGKHLRLGRGGLTIAAVTSTEEEGASPGSGIFMDPADIEELNILLRVGTPIRLLP